MATLPVRVRCPSIRCCRNSSSLCRFIMPQPCLSERFHRRQILWPFGNGWKTCSRAAAPLESIPELDRVRLPRKLVNCTAGRAASGTASGRPSIDVASARHLNHGAGGGVRWYREWRSGVATVSQIEFIDMVIEYLTDQGVLCFTNRRSPTRRRPDQKSSSMKRR
jgi:hypothetical protein